MSERSIHRSATLFLLGGCVLFCLAFSTLSLRELLAAHASRRGDICGLRRAVQLSPHNADYHAQLGATLLFSGDGQRAQAHLETATRLNPHEARYWLDLGRSYQIRGDAQRTQVAVEHALATGRTYGWVIWEAGLLYLGQNDKQKAFALFRSALRTDALPPDRVVDVCWRATHDARLMLDSLLPQTPGAYAALLGLLARDEFDNDADLVWRRMLAVGQAFPPEVSYGYIDSLLRQGRVEDASSAWRALLETHSSLKVYADTSNLIENGGFERSLLNGGFDWRYLARPDATLSLAADRAHSGVRALKLSFEATELWEVPVVQKVAVIPGTSYSFSAHVCTEGLWTLSGPRLRIIDAGHGTQYFVSSEFAGSTAWSRVEKTFTTGPDTHLLAVSLVRTPGDSSISGTLWLDDVSLTEAR